MPEKRPPAPEPERLQKVLARAGLGSRRACEELVRDGRVTVNGEIADLGRRVDTARDHVEVDGLRVPVNPDLVYFALNKPSGVVTTARDPQRRPDVSRYYPRGVRVFPVGRLDRDTEGLLLLTNDGELANRLTHPRYGAEKEYLAEVEGAVADRLLRRLERGVDLEDGLARAVAARRAAAAGGRTAVRMVMTEGRKREVRRMLAAVGLRVTRLVRVRVGPLRLKDLPPGSVRPLTPLEVRDLYGHVEEAERRARRRKP
ncbi:MAG TPA: pseudouridine synthase [Actinomycetota bacterium]|nr:pseudouridine synthase [Actinomycetota bacterium]